MAAITTLLNPLLPSQDELMTFWNNDSGDLVLAQRKNPQKPADLIWVKMGKQTGILRNPSSIVSLQYQGLINVYGITSGEEAMLKRLSPTVEPLKHPIRIDQAPSLAGAVNDENAWLYYLADDGMDGTTIAEYALDGSSDPVTLGSKPDVDTYLAATCWSTGKRLVFFQNGTIKMLDVEAGNESNPKDTKIARKKTPMAACTALDAQGTERLYLYFCDSNKVLQRLTITQDGGNSLESLTNAPQLADWTQLAVTPGKTQNFVSYVHGQGIKQKVTIYTDQRK
ncbi:hypothetical protein MMC26_004738 [Xylographa opegraphella]|nr:hypothetical protein [Xylographa opegraphella]